MCSNAQLYPFCAVVIKLCSIPVLTSDALFADGKDETSTSRRQRSWTSISTHTSVTPTPVRRLKRSWQRSVPSQLPRYTTDQCTPHHTTCRKTAVLYTEERDKHNFKSEAAASVLASNLIIRFLTVMTTDSSSDLLAAPFIETTKDSKYKYAMSWVCRLVIQTRQSYFWPMTLCFYWCNAS